MYGGPSWSAERSAALAVCTSNDVLGHKLVHFSSVSVMNVWLRLERAALDGARVEGHPGWKQLSGGALWFCFGACLELKIRHPNGREA
jgi:hypothetical protein